MNNLKVDDVVEVINYPPFDAALFVGKIGIITAKDGQYWMVKFKFRDYPFLLHSDEITLYHIKMPAYLK